MARRTVGTGLLASILLVLGLAGLAASWAAWPRSSSTSPLAALFALAWGCTYFVAAILTWRRSRFAAPAFLVAVGLALFPATFVVPGGRIILPSLVVLGAVAAIGCHYLHTRYVSRQLDKRL